MLVSEAPGVRRVSTPDPARAIDRSAPRDRSCPENVGAWSRCSVGARVRAARTAADARAAAFGDRVRIRQIHARRSAPLYSPLRAGRGLARRGEQNSRRTLRRDGAGGQSTPHRERPRGIGKKQMSPIIPAIVIVAFARHHTTKPRKTRHARTRPRTVTRSKPRKPRPLRRNCPGDRCPTCAAPMASHAMGGS